MRNSKVLLECALQFLMQRTSVGENTPVPDALEKPDDRGKWRKTWLGYIQRSVLAGAERIG
jgi:hypothetical protein